MREGGGAGETDVSVVQGKFVQGKSIQKKGRL